MKSMMLGTVLLVGFAFPAYGDAGETNEQEQREGMRILELLVNPYTNVWAAANRVRSTLAGCIYNPKQPRFPKPERVIRPDRHVRPIPIRQADISTIFSMDDEQLDVIRGLTDAQYKAISSLGVKGFGVLRELTDEQVEAVRKVIEVFGQKEKGSSLTDIIRKKIKELQPDVFYHRAF
ncbi:MAG: hypothetical protein OYH77_07910 [Pseudomonadota bacterium]|nr:hypothetical protein [Pseudomonadota bacterium]